MKDDMTEGRERLWQLIKDMKFAMFTTRHENGHLHSRPMTTQNKAIDDDDSLWFFMSRHNETVQDLHHSDEVNVSYADPGKDSYVSVSGKAEVVEDAPMRHRLWSKMNDAWFKNGPDDPEVALVRVRITHADYWDVDTNKLVQLIKMAKAAVSGDRPDMGRHGQVRMH